MTVIWMAFSVVIKSGSIVDGAGNEPYVADIGITGDKIAFIGQIDEEATHCIDARGKYVTPGFIDTHSHADCSVFLYPDCESYLRQGITTFIGGQCGDANAPIYKFWMRKYWEYDMWDDIDPFVYAPTTVQPVSRVLDVVRRKTGFQIEWRSLSEYARVLDRLGLGCNMIMLAGHSQIRADVMRDAARRPDRDEMTRMKAHLDDAFEAGAWGFSTGRDYPPSAYADMTEILELAEYARGGGGYYFTHWRRTGPRLGTHKRANKLEGITEALDVALSTGIKTQISHLSTGYEIYPEDPQMDSYAAQRTLWHIDEYIDRGADVAFDVIPGTSGGIGINPYLASLLMPWVKQSGSLARFVKNLASGDYRARLLTLLRGGELYALNPLSNPSWDSKIYITSGPEGYVGKNIQSISKEKCLDPLEATLDLLIEAPRIMILRKDKSEEEVRGLLEHERGFVCTDTYAFDLRGIYGNDGEFPEMLPHPHTYCAFPKYILSCGNGKIEGTIRKITGAPAEFMGIKGRGAIRVGNYADLVVLDMKRLTTHESYIEPRVYPEGIDYVMVNGAAAVEGGKFTGMRSGLILKR
jgi:N-acyl-D-aspartate/D-glutamate deacylase